MRREDDGGTDGNLSLVFDEDGPAPLQLPDNVLVVDDLLANVDWRTVQLQRSLDRLDGPLHTGTVAPGRGKNDPLDHRE